VRRDAGTVEGQVRRDAGTVEGQVRRDAGRTRFRCVSGAKDAARQCFWVRP